MQFLVALPSYALVSLGQYKAYIVIRNTAHPLSHFSPNLFSLRTRVECDTLSRWRGFRGFNFYILVPIERSSYLTDL